MKKFSALIIVLSLFLSSCSQLSYVGLGSDFNRMPASEVNEINYYLAIDKFHYYVNEYANAMSGKIPDEAIETLRGITTKEIIDLGYGEADLTSAKSYDDFIYDYLTKKQPDLKLKKSEMQWGYNFFKTKLDEAFVLAPSKLDIKLNLQNTPSVPVKEISVPVEELNPSDMTLDSGHYISNRTTRAIFWEAIENDRAIEFHMGDSREFLKGLKEMGGEILYEVKPLAKNYNKIFIVKYPGDESYRYAITNIGGKDRLEHLVHQVSLSNFSGKPIKSQILLKGDIEQFQASRTAEHIQQLKLMPKADRVIVGQKESIDGKFQIFWKIKALQNLYEENPKAFDKALDEKTKNKFFQVINANFEVVFKDKKIIEDTYALFEEDFKANPKLLPPGYKVYNFDNFTVEMCDYVFQDHQGKEVRWRVLSNVWGDEIVPMAQALKATGHTNLTYMGTAGAFGNKGYKVGDLVIPTAVQTHTSKLTVSGKNMDIPGAKIGGSVEHVGSVFEESHAWLDKVSKRSEFVEVETSYLREIFKDSTDNLELYLLISDVLGSENETLAHATSSKRKNAQNKLLASLFTRDTGGKAPTPILPQVVTETERLRQLIESAIPAKSTVFKYYVFSHLKGRNIKTIDEVVQFAENADAFTDNFLTDRMSQISEGIKFIRQSTLGTLPPFKLAFDRDLVDGKWNPKKDRLKLKFKFTTAESKAELEKFLTTNAGVLKKFNAAADVVIEASNNQTALADEVVVNIPERTDYDLVSKIYSEASFKQAGLYTQSTYNGNLKYDFLPTQKSEAVCDLSQKFCTMAFFPPTDEVFEGLKTSADIVKFNAHQRLKKAITDANNMSGFYPWLSYSAEYEVVKSLPSGSFAEIVPEIDAKKGLVVKLKITNEGLKYPLVVLEEIAHLKQITGDYFVHPMAWAEATMNAQHGSNRAKLFLAHAEVKAQQTVSALINDELEQQNPSIDNYIDRRTKQAEDLVHALKKKVKEEDKARKAIGEKYAKLQDALEKNEQKLNDYIAKNDRKNVKKLIESFMPWNEMEPTEIATWKRHLDAMLLPVDKDNAVLTFRGLQGDLVSMSDKGPYLMSTLLAKNQGNYTRRLRSLKTYYGKLGKSGVDANYVSPPFNQRAISVILSGHNVDPVSSPYISAAPYMNASSFVGLEPNKGLAVIKLHKDRLNYNVLNTFGEKESLIPMIIFPDEIVGLYDHDEIGGLAFYDQLSKKLGRKVNSDGFVDTKEQKVIDQTLNWLNKMNPEGIVSPVQTTPTLDLVPGNSTPDATKVKKYKGFAPKPDSNCNEIINFYLLNMI